jgi:predicted GNAT superfamily acetyltransferase
VILDCARRTSTFLSCAFREQEDDQAAHLFHASKDFSEDGVDSAQPTGVREVDRYYSEVVVSMEVPCYTDLV